MQWLALPSHSMKGLISRRSPWLFGFLPQSKDMHSRLIKYFKLSVGVNVSVEGLCVGPVINQ